MRIGTKLLLTYLVVSTIGIGVLGLHDVWSYETYFRESSESDLGGRATALATSVAEALKAGNLRRVQTLAERNGLQDGIQVRVIAPDGRLLASSDQEQDRHLTDWSDTPGTREALRGERVFGVAQGIFARGDRLYHARPIRTDGRLVGVLRMSVTLEHFHTQLAARWRALILSVAATFGLCALASFWLSRSFAAPIQSMRDFALQIGAGRFDRRLQVRRGDELGQLAEELSHMGERLATLDAERRAFLASVSHELRTPVTNVLVTLEALESGAQAEPELRERLLLSTKDELLRLNKLIEELLELGRLDAGVVALQREAVSLAALAERAVRAMQARAEAVGVRLRSDVGHVTVAADPERMCQVLLNVLENAVKYSRPLSVITLASRAEEECGVLEIHDEGPGIDAEDLPRVFDHFFVADPSRSGAGTGLGLAIARRIVDAHGGSISAHSAPGRGTTITIRLPRARAEDPPRQAVLSADRRA